jgi:hypothetical protein
LEVTLEGEPRVGVVGVVHPELTVKVAALLGAVDDVHKLDTKHLY